MLTIKNLSYAVKSRVLELTCVKLCAVVYTVAFESYLSLTDESAPIRGTVTV